MIIYSSNYENIAKTNTDIISLLLIIISPLTLSRAGEAEPWRDAHEEEVLDYQENPLDDEVAHPEQEQESTWD